MLFSSLVMAGQADCPLYGNHIMEYQNMAKVTNVYTGDIVFLGSDYMCDCGHQIVCSGTPHYGSDPIVADYYFSFELTWKGTATIASYTTLIFPHWALYLPDYTFVE